VPDEGRNPITLRGGSIDQLIWVNTPPLYVAAHAVRGDASSIDVAFDQKLKANTSKAGARVSVNGRAVEIESATLQPDRLTVRYRLAAPIRPNDFATWAYDTEKGNLENLDGEPLHSGSEKKIEVK
jgi:hypothetical protein